jgi:hypothetical protein
MDEPTVATIISSAIWGRIEPGGVVPAPAAETDDVRLAAVPTWRDRVADEQRNRMI